MPTEATTKVEHGGDGWFYDNLGEGWRMQCLCGFQTTADIALSVCGEEMDEHLYEVSDAN